MEFSKNEKTLKRHRSQFKGKTWNNQSIKINNANKGLYLLGVNIQVDIKN